MAQWIGSAASEEEALLKEVQAMALVSHAFWLLWSVVQGHVSTIQFGYLVREQAGVLSLLWCAVVVA